MKNIYLIVGRSGVGKTTVVQELSKRYGYKEVQSYTTRLPRYEGETGHIFITPEEFDKLENICAYTEFMGNRYGVTSDIIDENDLYVIDPYGVEYMSIKYNGNKGIVVIGIIEDVKTLYNRMIARGDTHDHAIERLYHDNEAFKNLLNISDVIFRNRVIEDTIQNIHSFIENNEKKEID